ncbi:MAG: YCF48-related protein [Zavarzinella sp.]
MNRFQRVQEILDTAVGGPSAPAGPHSAFWRGITRDEFVAKKIFGLELITVGSGAGSILIKALKGETPFGADTGNDEADYNRMPSGRDPVPNEDITFIQQWIDEGCLEDPYVAVAPLAWRTTNAPVASARTDDIWFSDPLTGWAVNSDGTIVNTIDGGVSWNIQHSAPGVYFRCISFADSSNGWAGTLSRSRRLFQTADGGNNWTRVTNLPADAPVAICGISVVNNQVVYGSGTNRPEDFPGIIKTTDGGTTWSAIDMSDHASILIDVYFTDPMHGWVVGGKANEPTPTTRDKVKPVVLETNDGGVSWINRLAGQEDMFPFGEWGWKIQFLNDKLGFVSLENFTAGAILKTVDGGKTWKRIKINDPQGNVNLEGVGFIDEQRGWVGGWGSDFTPPGPTGYSSATTDGGETWTDANEIGLRINRFRFFGKPVTVGYASGFTVYKYTSSPLPAISTEVASNRTRPLLPVSNIQSTTFPVDIQMDIPDGTRRLTLHVWDRFGVDHGYILDEVRPDSGLQFFRWDGIDDRGNAVIDGDYILRLTADDTSASSTLSYRSV